MLHFGKIPKNFGQIWRKFSKNLAKFAKFWKKQKKISNFNENFEIREPLRSAVLARALHDISIITQQGLAALLLAAEPRPATV